MPKTVITLRRLPYIFRRIRDMIVEATSTKLEVDMSNADPGSLKRKYDSANTITTAGTGDAYTATVPGIKTLTAGMSFTMIPHVSSSTGTPTLDVNGLGAKPMRQRLSSNTAATAAGPVATWLSAGYPVEVVYNGTLWAVNHVRPSATYLYGTVPIDSGGTGATNAADALTNLGAVSAATHMELVGDVDELRGSLTTLRQQMVSYVDTTLTPISEQVETNTKDISDLKTTVGQHDTSIGELKTSVDDNSSAIAKLQSDTGHLAAKVESAMKSIEDILERLEAIEGDLGIIYPDVQPDVQ